MIHQTTGAMSMNGNQAVALACIHESLKFDVCIQHKHDSVGSSLLVVDSATLGNVLHLHYVPPPQPH